MSESFDSVSVFVLITSVSSVGQTYVLKTLVPSDILQSLGK